ncbi:hypothetical protein VTI74DRAFT_2689 [Chaetomium olivicolor]
MSTISQYSKPLPPQQPEEAPAELRNPLSGRDRQKCAARHAAKEEARAPGQRLITRDHLDALVLAHVPPLGEITKPEFALVVKKHVLQLQVSVHDAFGMQALHKPNHLADDVAT